MADYKMSTIEVDVPINKVLIDGQVCHHQKAILIVGLVKAFDYNSNYKYGTLLLILLNYSEYFCVKEPGY